MWRYTLGTLLDNIVNDLQRLTSYYNLHKHELTRDNESYLIAQIDSLSEKCRQVVQEYYICLKRNQNTKKSTRLESIQD